MHNEKDNSALINQYNRLAEDWRHLSTLIWGVPAVAISIASGIVTAAFEFVQLGWPRIALLSIGAFFVLTLSIATAKYRFFHESRSHYMQDIEDKLGIHKFPITTQETNEYMKDKQVTEDRLYKLLSQRRSAIWLLYAVFITFLVLSSLAIYSAFQFVAAATGNLSSVKNTDTTYMDFSFLSHPLFLLLVGALLTGYLIPRVSRQWRKPKELELKINLINNINESVASIISETYIDQVSELEDDEEFRKAQRTWEIEKEVISSHLYALFPDSSVINDWRRFSYFISSFYIMNQIKNNANNNEERRKHLKSTLRWLGIDFPMEKFEAIVKRGVGGVLSDDYGRSWLDLKEIAIEHKNELVKRILKMKISSL